ncbi:site-specific integrase [uncultured Marivita sp.]|uniref:tyrosine-type recombinase/integrase n=1 Tax=uncultured Marivita sp. TaxID=888080 RepID=UPI003416E267
MRGGRSVAWYENGKRKRHQLKSRDLKEAEAEAIDVYKRKTSSPLAPTVSDLWQEYVEDRKGRPVAETMIYTGKSVLKHFGALRADQIEAKCCRDYAGIRDKAGVKPGTVWTELGHLTTVLNWAKNTRLIDHVPSIPRPQKPAPKDRYLTRQEINRLLDAASQPHIKLAILLMLSTAARVGAILELTWDRVNFDRNQIDLRKSASGPRKGRAVVPINPGLRDALLSAKEAALSDYVIEWGGQPIKKITRGFSAAAKAAGLENVTPHVLRHTSAVHMAEAGIPMSEISQYMGHSNTSITERVYARFSPDHLRHAADVLDFTQRD